MFRQRRWKFGQVVAALAVCCSVGATPVLAQSGEVDAFLQTGDCSAEGVEVMPLTSAIIPAGAKQGNQGALPAASSFTSVPLSLDTLLASDYAVVIADNGAKDWQGCGVIGGSLTDAGALTFGIASIGASGLGGVAFLSPTQGTGDTGFSLFLTGASIGQGGDQSAISISTSGTEVRETPEPAQQEAMATAEEIAYISTMTPILSQMEDSFNRFMVLYADPKIGEDDWSVSIVTEFVLWKQLHQQVSEIVPPDSMANLHTQAVGAIGLYAAAGTDIINAIDKRDTTYIDAATVKLARATDSFLTVRDEFERLEAERLP